MNILAGNNNSWNEATTTLNKNNSNNNEGTTTSYHHASSQYNLQKNAYNLNKPMTSPSLYNSKSSAGYQQTTHYYSSQQLTPPPSIKQETLKQESSSTNSGTSSPQSHLNHQYFRPMNPYQQHHQQQVQSSATEFIHNPYHSLAFAAAVVQQSLTTFSPPVGRSVVSPLSEQIRNCSSPSIAKPIGSVSA